MSETNNNEYINGNIYPLNTSKIEQTILTTKYQIKKEITTQEKTIQKNIGYKTEKENKQIVDNKERIRRRNTN